MRTEMELIDVLKRTRALLAAPETWTKHQFARTETGSPCSPLSENAQRYCLLGALMRSTSSKIIRREAKEALTICLTAVGAYVSTRCVYRFNDDLNTAHGDVVDLLDETITMLES